MIRDLLENDDTLHQRTNFSVEVLCDLSKFCLTSCYFVFNDKFFIQSDGVAMGRSLGCVVANIYMSFFETMALRLSPASDIMPPFFWIRYVDDVLAIFSDADQVAPFLAFLNSLRPSIRFTVEMELSLIHI